MEKHKKIFPSHSFDSMPVSIQLPYQIKKKPL
jgi:hypothetical protein